MAIKDVFIKTIKNDKRLISLQNDKNTGSFIEILNIPSSQSFVIRLGNTIEDCFKNYVKEKATIVSETINSNQADLYFLYNDLTYYFEVKNNVNLDTEKTKDVENKLFKALEKVNVVGCLSFRSATKEELNKFSKSALHKYLYGYNDFFKIFNEYLSKEDFEEIINTIKDVYVKKFITGEK
jgi:hypothetical protein